MSAKSIGGSPSHINKRKYERTGLNRLARRALKAQVKETLRQEKSNLRVSW